MFEPLRIVMSNHSDFLSFNPGYYKKLGVARKAKRVHQNLKVRIIRWYSLSHPKQILTKIKNIVEFIYILHKIASFL